MARITISTAQFANLDLAVRALVRNLRRLAVAAAVGVAAIALLLRRDGFDGADTVLTLLLLAAPAFVLFFARGVLELVSLPDRLRKMPGEGQERLTELGRVAGQARTARVRNVPFLLWRLRSSVGSMRDVAGIALPLKVLAPSFLGFAALAAFACLALVGVGVIALLVLVSG